MNNDPLINHTNVNSMATLDPGSYNLSIDYAKSVYPPPVSSVVFTDQYGQTISTDEQVRDSYDMLLEQSTRIENLYSDISFMQSQFMLMKQDYDALVLELKKYNAIPGGGKDGIL